jgi:ABC-type transport system involved in multi-copper enzyme maturation permease subunit
MFKSYTNECIKIAKHPVSIWLIVLFGIFIIYSYISVGIHFQSSYATFIENSSFSEQQAMDFIKNSNTKSPLTAMLFIISTKMAIPYSLASVNALGPIVISIIGALVFGIEYRHFTIRQLWMSGLTRTNVLIGKVLSMLTFIICFILISIIIGLLSSFVTPYIFDLPTNLVSTDSIQVTDYFLQILGTIISLLLWGVFAACITVLSKSLVVGVIVGFIYPTMESSILHSWYIGQYFPLFIQKSMLPILFKETENGGLVSFYDMPEIYTLNQSLLLSFIYTLIFIIITLIALKKQKIPMP